MIYFNICTDTRSNIWEKSHEAAGHPEESLEY